MTKLRNRVEQLEARLSPAEPLMVHIVGWDVRTTGEEALASYGEPIGDDNEIIYLVPLKPRSEAA